MNQHMEPNECMAALPSNEAHGQLCARWTVQTTPLLLYATINLALSFGAEIPGWSESEHPTEWPHTFLWWWWQIYMFISASAFVLNVMAFVGFVRLIADVGRVGDGRMGEFLKKNLTLADTFGRCGMIATMLQVGMAFVAVVIRGGGAGGLIGFVLTYIGCIRFMVVHMIDPTKQAGHGRYTTRPDDLYKPEPDELEPEPEPVEPDLIWMTKVEPEPEPNSMRALPSAV